jgi:NAD+ kinase
VTFTLGLVVHPTRPVRDSVEVIVGFADRYGLRVVTRAADATRVGPGVEPVDPAGFADLVNAMISLGGDGTMLGAMRLVVGRDTPVLGVNHGNLGFLVEITPDQLPAALDRMVEQRYTLEPHSCLTVDGGPVAFSDVVVTAARPLTTVTADLSVNDARYGYYRCDAVVACTPTGSTAYNYAAGGPIVSPSHPSITLTPVAPMSGISRSVVLGGDAVVLHNPSDTEFLQYTVDGVPTGRIAPGDKLTVALSPDAVNVVRLDAGAHAQRSAVKLSLLDLPVRPDQLIELIPPELRARVEQMRHRTPDGEVGPSAIGGVAGTQ